MPSPTERLAAVLALHIPEVVCDRFDSEGWQWLCKCGERCDTETAWSAHVATALLNAEPPVVLCLPITGHDLDRMWLEDDSTEAINDALAAVARAQREEGK